MVVFFFDGQGKQACEGSVFLNRVIKQERGCLLGHGQQARNEAVWMDRVNKHEQELLAWTGSTSMQGGCYVAWTGSTSMQGREYNVSI